MNPRTIGRQFVVCATLLLLASRTAAPQALPTVIEVAASHHILLLLSDGTVLGAVDNRSGQLGLPPTDTPIVPPTRVPLPGRAVHVAAGGGTSYAVLEDGTTWAWGQGGSGELGVTLPSGTFRATPAAVPGLRGVKKIAAGGAMILLDDGTVRALGGVARYFRGASPTGVTSQPVVLKDLTDIVDIAGNTGLGIATTRDGRAIAWDLMDHPYLLPDRTEILPAPPTEVAGLRDVISTAVQGITTAAVTADGSVWTWGQNSQAGLGNGTRASGPGTPPQFAPARVPGVSGAVRVAAGTAGRHYIVLRKDGTLIGWGNTDWGQLGTGGTARFQPTPTPIKLANVDAFWVGGNYSFARTKDGAFWFWGDGDGAAALLGTKRNVTVPTKVPLDTLLAAAR